MPPRLPRDLEQRARRLARPLARRAEQRKEDALAAARRRSQLRMWALTGAFIRSRLPEAANAHVVRQGEAAAAELAAIPDTPALRAADEALLRAEPGEPAVADPKAELARRLARLAAHCAEGEEFDPARASSAELLARAVLRGAR